ncbi:NAD-dependent epimerase/dehydratase family protein [Bacillus sp. S3]|uniref:NAD-dependent epimerase/dehydratase family protein n=1 Tax=Bacillus sp. S3 TaxID=486398 RepID=UPI00118AB4E6|nr:NAD-dependent epimerase/dehydratase family protein [Bacillus sp. S3]QCJ44765.1 NAD-dependent epimerase/dehydratase family protein [Bacillus sp. S3]
MKRILITAKNSYIGNAFVTWTANKYIIEFITCRTAEWKEQDFSKYDVILHVAGIAHVSTDPNMEAQYYKVNRDLTIELATKAKNEGVKQFIFLSSIIVYGNSSSKEGIIDKNTIPKPDNFYGNSKLLAEEGLKYLESENFKIAILRPPMIYGKGSKGNYPRLAKVAQNLPVFPDINNQRSMLHIDNLVEFIRLIIKNEERGLYFPQNSDYVKTSNMVELIAKAHGKNIKLTKVFNPLLIVLGGKVAIINKIFGNLVYEKSMSNYKESYQINDLRKSIELTELERR